MYQKSFTKSYKDDRVSNPDTNPSAFTYLIKPQWSSASSADVCLGHAT